MTIYSIGNKEPELETRIVVGFKLYLKYLQPRSQYIFSLKEALEHFKHVITIFPNRAKIFQNK